MDETVKTEKLPKKKSIGEPHDIGSRGRTLHNSPSRKVRKAPEEQPRSSSITQNQQNLSNVLSEYADPERRAVKLEN